ncbi:hypothetical protein F9B85_06840 [Heliorestis acidaminivorans]|uniref:Uncharacterized protein n=1 Tax=Heliorestis acidaminivorans TaxID=553427 RepID=A0A6I0EZP9_9FIRM|nr:hypothetical protein [Heliorestis acidaminivorans]KAB2952975.1 hypothetical protein F9B85_06840 [Heliorestis acidaminivorans]
MKGNIKRLLALLAIFAIVYANYAFFAVHFLERKVVKVFMPWPTYVVFTEKLSEEEVPKEAFDQYMLEQGWAFQEQLGSLIVYEKEGQQKSFTWKASSAYHRFAQ